MNQLLQRFLNLKVGNEELPRDELVNQRRETFSSSIDGINRKTNRTNERCTKW